MGGVGVRESRPLPLLYACLVGKHVCKHRSGTSSEIHQPLYECTLGVRRHQNIRREGGGGVHQTIAGYRLPADEFQLHGGRKLKRKKETKKTKKEKKKTKTKQKTTKTKKKRKKKRRTDVGAKCFANGP